MYVVMSIHPRHAENILSGEKTVEFRKRLWADDSKIDGIYLYATSPVQRVVGKIVEFKTAYSFGGVAGFWDLYGDQGCITEKEYWDYFGHDCTKGILVEILGYKTYTPPLMRCMGKSLESIKHLLPTLKEKTGSSVVPQSWRYVR